MFENIILKQGYLTVISGCMFSGKSTELLRLLKLCEIADYKVLLFKPKIDKRYSKNFVVTHCKSHKMQAINIEDSMDIIKKIKSNTQVVGIDEIQFFDEKIVEVVKKLLSKKISVVCAGLNTDFKGDPFGSMPTLLSLADNLIKVYAICYKCKNIATRTQRLIDGLPAKRNSPIILVGGSESYTAICVNCHKVL